MTVPTDLPVLAFPDRAALEAWLEAEHATAPGCYVRLAKKGAGVPSVTQAELVESLLCFGWIDGRVNRLDEHSYLVRVTPRRPRSVWSQKNVAAVAELTAAGRMRPAGLAQVEAARADGRWDRAYAGAATITVPDDLAAALAAEPAAQEAFAGLDATNRYAVLHRVHTAATPATRAKRVAAVVTMLAEGRRPHPAAPARSGRRATATGA
ncbi:YdeI/OmpD-associated family protein [Geodermatophilus sp. URMC 62]|uniref:YdeI/OmpD-associated family protein n=1 Tax=Geodermatophilus sp. URMC 62 TaxID=3423414 RepID=UPI00406C44F1